MRSDTHKSAGLPLVSGAIRRGFVVFGAVATFSLSWAAEGPDDSELPPEIPGPGSTESQISPALRSSVRNLVVIAGQSPPNREVTGTYEKETAGFVGGVVSGSRWGTINREIGGVPVYIPIMPVLGIPGAIFGGLSGATKQEIQAFRDRLTEEIAREENPPLKNDGLALDVFWGIRKLPKIESQLFAPSVEISGDTDSILYVSIDDLTIDVQGKDAIITAAAIATLRRLSDGRNVYQTKLRYQDRDTLKSWTQNDNALWREYTNFARFYLGREISADVFDRVTLSHELRPTPTDTAKQARKNKRKFSSRSPMPTLAWELTLKGGDAHAVWAETIDESDIFYDIEIFDNRALVYYEEQLADPNHTLAFELDACKTYHWSVRPVYHVAGDVKFGEWMQFDAQSDADADADADAEKEKGVFGRRASTAPAYIQDFALLEIDCRRR